MFDFCKSESTRGKCRRQCDVQDTTKIKCIAPARIPIVTEYIDTGEY